MRGALIATADLPTGPVNWIEMKLNTARYFGLISTIQREDGWEYSVLNSPWIYFGLARERNKLFERL